MKNVHKIRGKREFLFDDKDLVILGGGAIIICVLIFILGFMVGSSIEQQSLAGPLASTQEYPVDAGFAMGEEPIMEGTAEGPPDEQNMSDASGEKKTFQKSYYQVLPDNQTYVEVEATPTKNPEPSKVAEQESTTPAEQGQAGTNVAPVHEETPIPPPQNTTVASTPPRTSTAPSLPNVPKSPTDEIRVGRQNVGTQEQPALSGIVYSVQVASSQNLEDSENLRQKYAESGYQAYVMSANLGEKGIWYRVRVGNMSNRADAELLRQEIENRVGHLAKNPYIIKVTE